MNEKILEQLQAKEISWKEEETIKEDKLTLNLQKNSVKLHECCSINYKVYLPLSVVRIIINQTLIAIIINFFSSMTYYRFFLISCKS